MMQLSTLPIETARLRLDPLTGEDAPGLFACRGHPDVSRYQGWRPETVGDAAAFIARQAAQVFGKPDTWHQLAIRSRQDGALVGDLGIHFPASREEAIEFGISLAPDQQGKGLAREALAAVIDRAFTSWGYRRVIGSVDPRNRSSVALLRALGFRQEAHHVESLLFRGEWVDDLIFALLAREWRGVG